MAHLPAAGSRTCSASSTSALALGGRAGGAGRILEIRNHVEQLGHAPRQDLLQRLDVRAIRPAAARLPLPRHCGGTASARGRRTGDSVSTKSPACSSAMHRNSTISSEPLPVSTRSTGTCCHWRQPFAQRREAGGRAVLQHRARHCFCSARCAAAAISSVGKDSFAGTPRVKLMVSVVDMADGKCWKRRRIRPSGRRHSPVPAQRDSRRCRD